MRAKHMYAKEKEGSGKKHMEGFNLRVGPNAESPGSKVTSKVSTQPKSYSGGKASARAKLAAEYLKQGE